MSALPECWETTNEKLQETITIVMIDSEHVFYEDRYTQLIPETVPMIRTLLDTEAPVTKDELINEENADDFYGFMWFISKDLEEITGLTDPILEDRDEEENITYQLNPILEFVDMTYDELESLVAFAPKPKVAEVVALYGVARAVPVKKKKPSITVFEAIRSKSPVEEKILGPDENWWEFANCEGVDPELFFPERGDSTKEAKEVCKSCVVREACLDYAIETNQKFGVWGGESERGRRRIRRQRGLAEIAEVQDEPEQELQEAIS